MRSIRRPLACVALVMLAGVGLAAPPASAGPAQLQRDVWLPSNANYGSGADRSDRAAPACRTAKYQLSVVEGSKCLTQGVAT